MSLPNEIISGINDLEPLPRSARELMLAAMNENVSFADLATIVERDEAIASNLLRSVNSASGGGTRQIGDVRQAVIRIGLAGLTRLAVGPHIRRMTVDAPMYDLTEHEMWRHSVAAATAAGEIRARSSTEISSAAITAALVHDIGKLVMVRYLDGDVDEMLSLCETNELTWIEAERELIGCDHAEIGGAMAAAWNFPDEIRDAIVRHHESPIESSTTTLDTVVLANFVCRTIGVGLGAAGMHMAIDHGVLSRLSLNYESFCEICADTAQELVEV